MKILKLIFILCLLVSSNAYSQYQWEQTTIPIGNNGFHDIDFINPNTGFAAVNESTTLKIYKTTDKGQTFESIWTAQNVDTYSNFAIDFINANTGYVFYNSQVRKIIGGVDQGIVIDFGYYGEYSLHNYLKIFENGIGYCMYSRPDHFGLKIYKTTNFGDNWVTVYNNFQNSYEIVLSDLDISKTNPNQVCIVGRILHTSGKSKALKWIVTNWSFDTWQAVGSDLDTLRFDYVNFLPNNDIRILGNKGVYNYDERIFAVNPNVGFITQFGMDFLSNNYGVIALNDGRLMETSNAGYNWNLISTIGNGLTFHGSTILHIGDIIYYGDATTGNFFTRKLSTNLSSYTDNIPFNSSFSYDGSIYNTPSTQYLRGGYSSLFSDNVVNQGQSNEKILYKWSDGFNYSDHALGFSNKIYFENPGATISNHYKTKQLSTTSSSISNSSQSKSIRDTTIGGITATHTIHESIGGIFYSKSTNFGNTYQKEEVVNVSSGLASGTGNKNPSLCIIRSSGSLTPITNYDTSRNVAVVWERYDSLTQKIQINLAHRVSSGLPDNSFTWRQYKDINGNENITTFAAPSWFESKPTCYVIASPYDLQDFDSNMIIIIPHLRPNGSQSKLYTSIRYRSKSQDYQLDSGSIQDLSTISPYNYYSSHKIHFTYIKDNNVAYRKEEFGMWNNAIYRELTSPPPEVNNNISANDGYSARYRPDISLMDGLPVVSYPANYNTNAWVSYENGETDIINLNRYPIVKVQKQTSGL